MIQIAINILYELKNIIYDNEYIDVNTVYDKIYLLNRFYINNIFTDIQNEYFEDFIHVYQSTDNLVDCLPYIEQLLNNILIDSNSNSEHDYLLE